MYILLLLLLDTVYSTNDYCKYYSAGFLLDDCYYRDTLVQDRSYGYFCATNNNSTDTNDEYMVEYRIIDNGECSGSTSNDTVATFTCDHE